jgi:hypothetical protein
MLFVILKSSSILTGLYLIISLLSVNLLLSFSLFYANVELARSLLAAATSLTHSRLDYCNSRFLIHPASQLNCLLLILKATARGVTRAPKFSQFSRVLKYLHRLEINEHI